ncbi:hypothetical protein PMW03_05590 [Clostridium paraputrificum]|uniref:hypothetical protein n=1 Tax=Clostridium paraputrificum TaxID=29363 RepID=UPI00189B0564|nr:hypothetical protein [Clostridium paraputrificum]MDB2109617.1 hypothetical protein [Clostridium paraputrificum]
MVFFKKFNIYLIKTTSIKDNKGNIVTINVREETPIKVDIQPIDVKSKKYIWGDDIESNLQVYIKEDLEVGTKLIYKDRGYEVVKVVPWDDYSILAIKGVDFQWQ